jgi:glycosyltransferase involved in cell wall biosynthesis
VAWYECLAAAQHRLRPGSLLHLLRTEEHVHWLTDSREQVPVIGTVHLPPAQWSGEYRRALQRLSHAIVYYRAGARALAEILPPERIHFVPLGVDTGFFSPSREQATQPRFLFAGVYQRNTAMLARVVRRLAERRSDVAFDFLVPEYRRNKPGLIELRNHPAIRWHAGLSDDDLTGLYRQSTALLLPMDDSGANTAVVESLASGLPVITTDVGGIRDYGGGSVFPIVENNDDGAMLNLLERALDDAAWRNDIADRCRRFAEQELSCALMAQRHADVYTRALANFADKTGQ